MVKNSVEALLHYAGNYRKETLTMPTAYPGTGAAGGMGFAFLYTQIPGS